MYYVCMFVWAGSIVLNGDSAPYTSGESDDYEINKKYEMVHAIYIHTCKTYHN